MVPICSQTPSGPRSKRSDKIRFQDMFAAPVATVTQYYELVDGRARRPPSRYEPARLAASRQISTERRKECFEQTIVGQQGRSKGRDGQRERVEACCERTFTALLLHPPGSRCSHHPTDTPPSHQARRCSCSSRCAPARAHLPQRHPVLRLGHVTHCLVLPCCLVDLVCCLVNLALLPHGIARCDLASITVLVLAGR